MGHESNRDLRNTGDGGWFYAENELFSVFAPLIGIEGVGIYMAMCRLIPLAAVDPERPVTVRSVMEASCARRMTTNRKMAAIVALGMVLEQPSPIRNRPSTYTLVSLRKLAQLGVKELKRRIGVRRGDTDSSRQAAKASGQSSNDAAESRANGHVHEPQAKTPEDFAAASPAASARFGVPPTDTEPESLGDTDFSDSVSPTEASVSPTEHSVSPTEASVSPQRGHPLTKKKKIEEEDLKHTPPLRHLSALASEGQERRVCNAPPECSGVRSLPVIPISTAEAELIYTPYPRQEGRRSALVEIAAAVARLANGEGLPAMPVGEACAFLAEMVRIFAASPKARGQFVPHPATWFRESRYLDDVEQWHRPQTPTNAGGFNGTGSKGDIALAALAASLGRGSEAGTYTPGGSPTSQDWDAGAGRLRAGDDPVRDAGFPGRVTYLPPPARSG